MRRAVQRFVALITEKENATIEQNHPIESDQHGETSWKKKGGKPEQRLPIVQMNASRSHQLRRPSAEQLLGHDQDTEMSDLTPQRTEDAKDTSQYDEERYTDDGDPGRAPRTADGIENTRSPVAPVEYKVYKSRWFGLMQLVLLNIIVSWDVS